MISPEDKALELILLYGMDEIEAKAFKISCIYLEKAPKIFPNYQHYRYPKGDPRKSELFRHCHKLVREKGNKIADEDYKLYVHAQLDILKNIKKGDLHPLISPSCLSGDKAWKRWLLWKSRYEKALEAKMSSNVATSINVHSLEKIKKDLWKTKQFFIAWYDKLDFNDIMSSIEEKLIFRWYLTGSVCGYFLVLCNLVQNWLQKNKLDLKKEFNINLAYYKDARQNEVIEYFKSEFPNFEVAVK
jgi:hypothetical protein